jgi:hypothetical protein
MTWFIFVQMMTKSEFLLRMSVGTPKVSWPLWSRLKIKFSFFFWKPSVVKKLASLGKNRLLQPTGSRSNYKREEYSS